MMELSYLVSKRLSESFHSQYCGEAPGVWLAVSIRARMDILLAVGFLCTRITIQEYHTGPSEAQMSAGIYQQRIYGSRTIHVRCG